jgi:hypothetical protein
VKRWLWLPFVLLLPLLVWAAGSEQTINTLPNSNATFLTDLRTFLQDEDAARFRNMFTDFVVSGGTHSTGAGLTKTPTALVAYPGGYYTTESGSITYPQSDTCYVIAHKDLTGNAGTYTRVTGTHYLTDCDSGAEPTLPSNSVRLMTVITDASSVTTVTDRRTTTPIAAATFGASLIFEGATADDFETTLTVVDPTADRTVTIPDATGTLAFINTAQTISASHVFTGAAVNWTGAVLTGASPLVFEGATANDFETTFAITDPTVDRTITFQDQTGTVMFLDVAQTVTGAMTFNGGVVFNEAGADLDFRIESTTNASAFVLDAGLFGGVGAVGIGSAVNSANAIRISRPAMTGVADSDFIHVRIVPGGAVTIPAGTSNLVASLAVGEPNITATGAVTTAATLYIDDAPTEGGSNYALLVDAGLTRLDGALEVRGSAPTTPVADTIYEDSIVKAWVTWSYSGGVPGIDDDFNVASLDDDGTGDIGINFATALASANYGVATTGENTIGRTVVVNVRDTAFVDVLVSTSGAVANDDDGSLIVVGE